MQNINKAKNEESDATTSDEESPLSSKVAMFNNAATQHQASQHLNPFSQTGGLPKPTFSKNEYGKPLAGSLTEMRGQKANIHVLKEMLELCQIIDSEGYDVKDEPNMKVIPFGELFNIYTYISDKVVGILLRARKHKLIDFEGEVLFQRRDDDVPVFLLKPIKEIRQILEQKQDEIRRSVSPAPQATSVMMDQHRRGMSLSPTPVSVQESKKSIKRNEGSSQQLLKPIAQKALSVPTIEIEPEQTRSDVINAMKAIPKVLEEPVAGPAVVAPEASPAAPAPTTTETTPTKVAPAVEAPTVASPAALSPAAPALAAPAPAVVAPTVEVPAAVEPPAPAPAVPAPAPAIATPTETAQPKAAPAEAAPSVATQEVKSKETSAKSTSSIGIAAALSESAPTTSKPDEVIDIQLTPPTPTPTSESSETIFLTPAASSSSNPVFVQEKTDLNNNDEAPAIVVTVEASSNTETEPPAEPAATTASHTA